MKLKASVTHSQALKLPAGTPNQPSVGPMPRQVHSPTRMAMASKARSRLIARIASTKGAYRRRTPSASVMRIAPAMISAQVRPMTIGARSTVSRKCGE